MPCVCVNDEQWMNESMNRWIKAAGVKLKAIVGLLLMLMVWGKPVVKS